MSQNRQGGYQNFQAANKMGGNGMQHLKIFAIILLFILLPFSAVAESFVEEIKDIPAGTADAIVVKLKEELVSFIEPFLGASKTFILSNPNPADLIGYWKLIIVVITSFYLLLFLVAGLKFILGAYDFMQREEAKVWFKNSLFLVVVLNASYLLYTVLMDLGSGVALIFWDGKFEALFTFASIESLNLFSLIYLATSVSLLWFTLFLRYALLFVGVVLFPIGLFLYFIPPLKTYGSAILNLFGTAIFIQLVDVFTLIIISLTLAKISGPDFQFLIPSTAFLIIFFMNTMMLLMAIGKAVTSTKAYSPNLANVVNYVTPPASYLSPVERAEGYYGE